jgi:hypothetical protein
MNARKFTLAALVGVVASLPWAALGADLGVGTTAPAFSYNLINGHTLKPAALGGHPYVLWLVTTWCPSCAGGSVIMGKHIAELRAHGVRVVEVEPFGNLGYQGMPLQSLRDQVGPSATSSNWYWAQLTQAQTLALDPRGYPDIYYLIDAKGKIVTVDGSPAATWKKIAQFSSAYGER